MVFIDSLPVGALRSLKFYKELQKTCYNIKKFFKKFQDFSGNLVTFLSWLSG